MKENEIANRPNLLWADRQLMYRNARVEIEREQQYKDMFKRMDADEQKRLNIYKQNVMPHLQQ